MHDIIPLARTQVDWKTFVKTCQEVLGTSPTRGLDAEGIDVKGLEAYLACLGFDNQPRKHLRDGFWDGSFKHYHFSFITVIDLELITIFCGDIDIHYQLINPRKSDCLAIYTGNMEQWLRFIHKYTKESARFECRATACRILNHFENLGFKDLWSEYKKKDLNDKTFILVSAR